MNELETGVLYKEREYFPKHEMETVFQMHIKENVRLDELPAVMEVDYVKVSQYFLSPEIDCPEIITDTGLAVLDVDERATNIKWRLESDDMFEVYEGTGKTAEIVPELGESGDATITYSFQMPSGETFYAETDFLVEKATSSKKTAEKINSRVLILKITPNPASSWVIIAPEINGQWSLNIYSADMQLIKMVDNISDSDYKLDVSTWKPGFYLVHIKIKNSTISGKLVVQ